MAPKLSRTPPSATWQYGEWITPTCFNRLNFGLTDTSWGKLVWTQTFPGDSNGYVRVDILDSEGSTLVEDLEWNSEGVDLSQYNDISSKEDIKIKFKLFKKTESPIITKIGLRFKENW